MKVGRAIKMSRENVHFSVDVMAGKIGIPPEILIDIENGRSEISLCLLQKIAMVLGFSINRLNTISASISDPKDEIKDLQRRLLLSVQPILIQRL